jgi:hypothetical protein
VNAPEGAGAFGAKSPSVILEQLGAPFSPFPFPFPFPFPRPDPGTGTGGPGDILLFENRER